MSCWPKFSIRCGSACRKAASKCACRTRCRRFARPCANRRSLPQPDHECHQVQRQAAKVDRDRVPAPEPEYDQPGRQSPIPSRTRPLPFTCATTASAFARNTTTSIFRIFKRLHGRDQFGGGTGVGLTIVKKIIERHGDGSGESLTAKERLFISRYPRGATEMSRPDCPILLVEDSPEIPKPRCGPSKGRPGASVFHCQSGDEGLDFLYRRGKYATPHTAPGIICSI